MKLVTDATAARIMRSLQNDGTAGNARGLPPGPGRWVLVRCDSGDAIGGTGTWGSQFYPATIVEAASDILYPPLVTLDSTMIGTDVLLTVIGDDISVSKPVSGRLYAGILCGNVDADETVEDGIVVAPGRPRVVAPVAAQGSGGDDGGGGIDNGNVCSGGCDFLLVIDDTSLCVIMTGDHLDYPVRLSKGEGDDGWESTAATCIECAGGSPDQWFTLTSGGTGAFAGANLNMTLARGSECQWSQSTGGWTGTMTVHDAGTWTFRLQSNSTSAYVEYEKTGDTDCCTSKGLFYKASDDGSGNPGDPPDPPLFTNANACDAAGVVICGVKYIARFTKGSDGRPTASLRTVESGSGGPIVYDGQWLCCTCKCATFGWRLADLCPDLPLPADICDQVIRLTFCTTCCDPTITASGWYGVYDAEGAYHTVEMIYPDDSCYEFPICGGPFATQAEAAAACTPSSQICCPDTIPPRVLRVSVHSDTWADDDNSCGCCGDYDLIFISGGTWKPGDWVHYTFGSQDVGGAGLFASCADYGGNPRQYGMSFYCGYYGPSGSFGSWVAGYGNWTPIGSSPEYTEISCPDRSGATGPFRTVNGVFDGFTRLTVEGIYE